MLETIRRRSIAVLNGRKFRPIHLCWLFRKLGLPIPPLVGAGTPFTLSGSRIANATRVWQAAEDVSITGWDITADLIFAIAVESGAHAAAQGTLQIGWRNKTDGGSFTPLSASGELTWFGVTDLVTNDPVTSEEAGCTGTGTFSFGTEEEECNFCVPILLKAHWSEYHFAVDFSNAHAGDEYEFEFYDISEGTAVGTCLATVTTSAAPPPAYIPKHSGTVGVLMI